MSSQLLVLHSTWSVHKGERTLLLVNLRLDVGVEAHDDQVAEEVETPDGVEHIGILKGDLLGHLHHTKYDDDVGPTSQM